MTNRRYKNIDKKLHASLLASFPTIKEVISDENIDDYRHVAITVWDHWLSEQEAAEEFGDLLLEKEKLHNEKLHAFVCDLTSTYPSYLVKFAGPYKKRSVCLKTFTSVRIHIPPPT